MKRAAAIPKGATGVYRSDCPTSPPRFEEGETITVVKKGPVGHCIVGNAAGVEAVIRNSEIVLDAPGDPSSTTSLCIKCGTKSDV